MTYTYESTYFDDPPVEGRVFDIFMPSPGKKLHDVSLFIVHGGGWRGGSRHDFHWLMRPLNQRGVIVCSTDYRLKGTKIAQQVEDMRLGWALFQKKLKELGRPSTAAVYGSSAGAHLALLLALAKPGQVGDALPADPTLRKLARIRPAAAIVQAAGVTFERWDQPFPHGRRSIEGIVGARYDERPDLFRKASPMRYIGKDSPPVFHMMAENEHIFPHHLAHKFDQKMRAAGRKSTTKVYKTAEHGFFFELVRKCQKDAFRDFCAYLDALAPKKKK